MTEKGAGVKDRMDRHTWLTGRLWCARHVLGQRVGPEAVEWATAVLHQGADTPHLWLLAGYTAREMEENPEQFLHDLEACFRETGIQIASRPDAWSELGCAICRAYLSGELPYQEARNDLYDIWRETTVHHNSECGDQFDVWLCFSDSLDLIASGHGPLLDQLEGMNLENQESYFRREAERFLHEFGAEEPPNG